MLGRLAGPSHSLRVEHPPVYPRMALSCSLCWFVLTVPSTVFLRPFRNDFLPSQLLLTAGQLSASAHTELHPAVLRIFRFIKSIFSASPVSKSICFPPSISCHLQFYKHTVCSIIHRIDRNAGKIRHRFRMNLHIALLGTASV